MNKFWKVIIAANGAIGIVGVAGGDMLVPFLNLTVFFTSLGELINDE